MAVGLATASANSLLDTWGGTVTHVQLHTGDPGASGTANVAGNSTRKAVTWSAAASGQLKNSADITWTDAEVNTSETYTHVSFWNAATSGTFRGSGTLTANAVNASGDEFKILTNGITLSFTVAS